jgi:hypothetical protein
MKAFLLLAAAASASLGAPWWLFLALVVLAARAITALRQPGEPALPTETVVATIFVRSGRLVLRRRG